jgi:NADH-quinone oxidoreductase subunit L
MTVALGASAYGVAIFHLMTHAFFKALLFLAAGSVIIGMHHEQDMRKMGGLARYMPVTAITCWIGALALIGTPFFSGFYSKDLIIEAVHESHRAGATYAYWCVLIGVFITALYTFRMIFMTFHGKPRWQAGEGAHAGHEAHGAAAHADGSHDSHGHGAASGGHDGHGTHDAHGHDGHHGGTPHESPWVVTLPLVLLAIPSLLIGALTVVPVVFGGYFGDAIQVLERNDVVGELGREFPGVVAFALQAFAHPAAWLALGGVVTAWLVFHQKPSIAAAFASGLAPLRKLLENKYYFDWFNENVIAAGSRALGRLFWRSGDQFLIDDGVVNGSAGIVGAFASIARRLQTGYLYSYAFWMVIGLALMLGWFLVRA